MCLFRKEKKRKEKKRKEKASLRSQRISWFGGDFPLRNEFKFSFKGLPTPTNLMLLRLTRYVPFFNYVFPKMPYKYRILFLNVNKNYFKFPSDTPTRREPLIPATSWHTFVHTSDTFAHTSSTHISPSNSQNSSTHREFFFFFPSFDTRREPLSPPRTCWHTLEHTHSNTNRTHLHTHLKTHLHTHLIHTAAPAILKILQVEGNFFSPFLQIRTHIWHIRIHVWNSRGYTHLIWQFPQKILHPRNPPDWKLRFSVQIQIGPNFQFEFVP